MAFGAPSSETEAEILDLAKAADDARERAFLLLLLKINKSLDANTEATSHLAEGFTEYRDAFHQHRLDFQNHVAGEISLISEGRGVWRVLAVVLSVAQVVALAVAGWYVKQDSERQQMLKAMSEALIRSDARHTQIEIYDRALTDRMERVERKVFGQ